MDVWRPTRLPRAENLDAPAGEDEPAATPFDQWLGRLARAQTLNLWTLHLTLEARNPLPPAGRRAVGRQLADWLGRHPVQPAWNEMCQSRVVNALNVLLDSGLEIDEAFIPRLEHALSRSADGNRDHDLDVLLRSAEGLAGIASQSMQDRLWTALCRAVATRAERGLWPAKAALERLAAAGRTSPNARAPEDVTRRLGAIFGTLIQASCQQQQRRPWQPPVRATPKVFKDLLFAASSVRARGVPPLKVLQALLLVGPWNAVRFRQVLEALIGVLQGGGEGQQLPGLCHVLLTKYEELVATTEDPSDLWRMTDALLRFAGPKAAKLRQEHAAALVQLAHRNGTFADVPGARNRAVLQKARLCACPAIERATREEVRLELALLSGLWEAVVAGAAALEAKNRTRVLREMIGVYCLGLSERAPEALRLAWAAAQAELEVPALPPPAPTEAIVHAALVAAGFETEPNQRCMQWEVDGVVLRDGLGIGLDCDGDVHVQVVSKPEREATLIHEYPGGYLRVLHRDLPPAEEWPADVMEDLRAAVGRCAVGSVQTLDLRQRFEVAPQGRIRAAASPPLGERTEKRKKK